MTTLFRKLLVLGIVAVVLMLAGIHEIVRWLVRLGVPDAAQEAKDRWLSGTTVAIIVALVFLLRSGRPRRRWHDCPYDPREYEPPPCRRGRRDGW